MLKLSEDTKKTKAKLLVLSGVSLFIALSEALPTKVAILGLDLSKNEMITGWFVLAVTVYFLAYFIILSALNVIEYYLPSYIAKKTENITGDTIGLTKEECSPEDEDQYEYERGTTSGEMFEISRKSKIITYRYSNGFQRLSNYSTFMFEILLPVIFSVVSLMYLLCFLHHR